jgi:hypothetical protein
MPLPSLRKLEKLSPSLAADLAVCRLRAAFRMDPAWSYLRVPTPRSALGSICHEVAEAVYRGDFDDEPSEGIGQSLEREWDRKVQRALDRLTSCWRYGPVPSPTRWPGYHVARVRILRSLKRIVQARQAREGHGPAKGSPRPEVELEAPGLPMAGRIDRVEFTAEGTHTSSTLRQGQILESS